MCTLSIRNLIYYECKATNGDYCQFAQLKNLHLYRFTALYEGMNRLKNWLNCLVRLLFWIKIQITQFVDSYAGEIVSLLSPANANNVENREICAWYTYTHNICFVWVWLQCLSMKYRTASLCFCLVTVKFSSLHMRQQHKYK